MLGHDHPLKKVLKVCKIRSDEDVMAQEMQGFQMKSKGFFVEWIH
jgi:hypothetical protein